MRRHLSFFALFAAMVFAVPAMAQTVGISLPLSGRFEPVSARILQGAQLALADLEQNGTPVEALVVDDGCELKTAAEIANQFLNADVKLVVGNLCFRLARKMAELLNTKDGSTPTIPVIALNTRNRALAKIRDLEELPLYEIANSSRSEARAIVDQLLPVFDGKPFAITDDGSVYGRGLADAVRLIAEQRGLRAITNGNFRPLQTTYLSFLRRLQKSGVEAVVIAAGAEDIATIAADIKTLEYGWQVAAGETAQLMPFTENSGKVPAGLVMAAPKPVDAALAADFAKRLDVPVADIDHNFMLGYAMIEMARQIMGDGVLPTPESSYKTVVGPLTFDNEGRASPFPFTRYRWNGREFDAQTGTGQ